MAKIILDNWAGGENRGPEEKVAPNELSRMYGFIHTDGALRSSSGQTALALDGGASFATNPSRMYRYTAPGGSHYTLVCDGGAQRVFVDLELTEPAIQHRPIFDAGDASNTAWWEFVPFGDRLFFSRCDHVSTETTFPTMQWWDGFLYYTGGVTAAGSTTVTGVGTSNFPGVRAGDRIFIGADATCTTWNGPYVIKDINQIITITDGDGSDTFTVSYGGQTTAGLAYNVTAADMQTALEGLSSIGTGNVLVTGSAGGPYTIRLVGDLFQSDSLTAISATGTGCTAAVSFTLTIASNGPTVTNVPYLISRVHYAGLSGPGAPTCTAGSTGGSITPGDYLFASCWTNLSTGHRSDPVYAASRVTVGSGETVTVTKPGESFTQNGPQADAWQVWRETTAGSGVLYLVKTVKRDRAGYLLPDSTIIDGSETAGTTPLTQYGYNRPPRGGKIKAWNGYLWAWGVEEEWSAAGVWVAGEFKHRLYWSAYENPEAWNTAQQYGIIDPSDLSDPYTGGMIQIGDAGNPIMDLAIEGGTADNALYSNLLILTKFGPFHRFDGYNHDSFKLNSGVIDSTCISMRGLTSSNDLIGWWSAQGPVVKANNAGTNEVIPIYRKQFPTESRPFRDVYTGAYAKYIRGVNWTEWFVWAYPSTETTSASHASRVIMYHIPTGSWTGLCENDWGTDGVYSSQGQHWSVRDLCVWPAGSAGATNEEDRLYVVGAIYNGGATSVYLARQETKTGTATYWEGTEGVACLARTGFITGDDSYEKEKLLYMELCFSKPASQQTVTVRVYDAETGAAITAATQSVVLAAGSAGRHVKKIHLGNARTRSFQIEVSGTFTAQVVLHWIRILTAKGGSAS